MSVRKLYYKTKDTCKVTFRILKEQADVDAVYLVGDFNNWDPQSIPFHRFKNGNFEAIMELEKNRDYQFRYYLANGNWQNEPEADDFSPSPYGDAENSVIHI